MLISYYSDKNNKKLIIGNFRQRPQPLYEHAIEFSNSLDMIFGIETIYCVKDTGIIENIREGGEENEEYTVAIMFPFIRSQITLLTTQPGMTPIVLPPINTTKFE